MNKLKLLALSVAIATSIGLVATPAYADNTSNTTSTGSGCSSAKECISSGVNSVGNTGGSADIGAIIKTVVNVLLFVLGAISVIMIVVGGFKYVTSQGESSSLSSAKNTILYSVVGLVIAICAYGIVNFVLTQFT